MSRLLVLIFFLLSVMYGAEKSNWTHTHRYTLKKDEIANIGFSTTESKGADKNTFFFRWTSVVNNRVTILLNHKGYPHQYILYKKRSLDKVKFFFYLMEVIEWKTEVIYY